MLPGFQKGFLVEAGTVAALREVRSYMLAGARAQGAGFEGLGLPVSKCLVLG